MFPNSPLGRGEGLQALGVGCWRRRPTHPGGYRRHPSEEGIFLALPGESDRESDGPFDPHFCSCSKSTTTNQILRFQPLFALEESISELSCAVSRERPFS